MPQIGAPLPLFLNQDRTPNPLRHDRAAPGSGISHGRQVNAGNTGLNYNGISPASLTSAGATTLSTNGQTVSGKAFTGQLTITGSNVTVRNCTVILGGVNTFGIIISGNNCLIEGVTVTAPGGQSLNNPIYIDNGADRNVIRYCDVSQGSNSITNYGTNTIIEYTYCHDCSNVSDPTDHPDTIEVYGGSCIIRFCNLNEGTKQADGIINVAPWQASNPAVAYIYVTDCLLGPGGQEVILLDEQSTGAISNVRVLRCDIDQGTNPDTGGSFGVNRALTDFDTPQRPIVETVALQTATPRSVYWPHTSGPDVSRWVNATGVTPDLTGKIVVPPQSFA